jgi:hypothetical protein
MRTDEVRLAPPEPPYEPAPDPEPPELDDAEPEVAPPPALAEAVAVAADEMLSSDEPVRRPGR